MKNHRSRFSNGELATIGLLSEAAASDAGPTVTHLNIAFNIVPGTSQMLRNYLLNLITGPW